MLPSHCPSYLKSYGSQGNSLVPREEEASLLFFKLEKDTGGYRPMSLTSVPREVMDQNLKEGMVGHMENKGMF